jgi:hypothetical protein
MHGAETFADNPAVIGYDLLNEPFGDEVKEIGPLYEDVAARIRKHDQKAILFIEPQVAPPHFHAQPAPCFHSPRVLLVSQLGAACS